MKSLIRISQGNFNISDAKSTSDILEEHIISIENAFKNLNKIIIQPLDEKKFINGVTISKFNYKDDTYRVFSKNNTWPVIYELSAANIHN